MSETAATVFFVLTLPILLWSCYTDLRYMKITNRANLALFLIFVVLGLFFFEYQQYGIRLLQAGAMFIIGYLLTMGRLMGGGDSKLLAASAPFVALSHVPSFFMILAMLALLSVAIHRGLGLIPAFRRHVTDWVSWNNKGMFPYGVPITATVCVYFFINTGLVSVG